MKHLHMLMAVLTLGCFCYSAFCILTQKQVGKLYMAVTHTLYAVLVGTGFYLLWLLGKAGAGPQHWAYAKLILLVVAVSAVIKARKSTELAKAKAGLMVVFVALAGIVALAITKPVLGA